MKGALIEFLLVALIGLGAGVGLEALRPPAGAAEKRPEAAAPPPASVFDLAPIVTNLGSPQDTWIRLEGSIVYDPKVLPQPATVAAKIGEDALAYLRTTSLKQLEGPIGLQSIREDLNERAAIRSEGKVQEFVLRALVVQ